jgi:hypothetical protein
MMVGKQAESAALAASGGPHVLVQPIAVNAGFLLFILKEVAGSVSFRLEDTHDTSSKHVSLHVVFYN